MANILLITVNYHTPETVRAFCEAARAQATPDLLKIAVADNSSCFARREQEDAAAQLRKLDVTICDPGDNLGYFGGASFAYHQLCQDTSHPEWVIVANSDIAFLTDDFFARLDAFPIGEPVMGLGPDIVRLPAGSDPRGARYRENPLRRSRPSAFEMNARIWTLRSRLLTVLVYLRARLRRRHAVSKAADPLRRADVYMIHGSFMILHRRYFERTAGLDFPSFLYGEEIFVAEEVRRAGGTLRLEPTLRLAHVGGNSTDQVPSDRRRRWELASFEALTKKYFSGSSYT